MNYQDYKPCIDACAQCAEVCQYCASMCLKEEDVNAMAHCVQLNMECEAICNAAVQLMSLGSQYSESICKICAQVCNRCAGECEKYDIEHCRDCAAACRKCAEECQLMSVHLDFV
jgi:hypothetical protein